MAVRTRPYLFYDTATSICSTCYARVDAKVLVEDGRVFLAKRCPQHGSERVLLSDDAEYYRRGREQFLKPPEMPRRYNTPVRWGCPYDCGLCPDHEQHSCLTLVEVTDHCNLSCPICYSASGPERPGYRSLELIERMLDAVVANEGEPDVVQISGGEPTLHPELFAILDAARARPIRHLMLNTNGIRIAQEPEFAARLASYRKGFEVYLQFDSFEREALLDLRGADLRGVRERALERLNELGLSTTLVVTLKKGVNDREIGRIIDFALTQPAVRGVTFQPIQAAGRLEGYDPARDRLTLSEVRRGILEQTRVFAPEDVIPVPCHPDALAMAYALKLGGQVVPLTGLVEPRVLLEGGRNTIVYEQDQQVREGVFQLFSLASTPERAPGRLKDLLCCLPRIEAPGLGYDSLFRVLIIEFLDAHAFDVRSVKKTCIHVVQPDGRLIPLDTFNLFYRDDLERARLAPLRRRAEAYALGPAASERHEAEP